ncbi:MmcQ/YjbR family DNA-binding protein [Brevundimonas sp. AJA228-03]|uniref:MmcQ/YjbR family DNA-binding protein n=1 Tax=Brevundimonas sp. AJA228-03 TaxID=2752515 RepID=UPI001AE08D98|nr:MmcQ/YjbR family DNA-binding protein [Brevundimonas sp. AJA228-03]QTN18506.1 MmcQ/YjbR family DNA-binding protein [Brevundimonas sp. AJA228-03]
MTPSELHAMILTFPETQSGTSYGMPSYKAAGKFFTRLRAEDDSVVVYVDSLDHRDLLMEAEPETFHITDHYRGYPVVLARLATVDPVWLRKTLEKRWLKVVPKRVSRAYDPAS